MKNIQETIDHVVDGLDAEALTGPDSTIVQTPEPDPTADQVIQIVGCLQNVAEYNGYLGIARLSGVSTGTVRAVQSAINKRLAELSEAEVGEIEPKVIK